MNCLSLWKKSTLTPFTPSSCSRANSSRRRFRSCMRLRGSSVTKLLDPPELYQKRRPTPFSSAWATSCSMESSLIRFQLASTRE